jgi:hypothetical protein
VFVSDDVYPFVFQIVEGSADFLLQYIPFYLLIKVRMVNHVLFDGGLARGPHGANILFCVYPQASFLVWCYYPKTQGAKVIYSSVIKPYVVPALGIDEAAKKED